MKDILFYFTSPMVMFIAVLVVILLFVMARSFINRTEEEERNGDSEPVAITTKDMLKDVNEERRKAGLYEVPELNTAAGANTGNLARRDHSFKSVPDFFWQLFSKKEKE